MNLLTVRDLVPGDRFILWRNTQIFEYLRLGGKFWAGVTHVARREDGKEVMLHQDSRVLVISGSGFDESHCCHRCLEESKGLINRMIVCQKCGNKRCPKASDHRLDCTNSNERGQPGSVYA